MEDRRFDEQEARLILARAAEIQGARQSLEAGPYRRFSLEDLEKIGAESGLDREAVRRAAVGLAVVRPARFHVLGVPLRARWERSIDGEIDDAQRERMMDAIHDIVGEPGSVSGIGRSLDWHSLGPSRVQVRVRSRDGRTHIVVEDSVKDRSGGVFGGVVGGVGGGTSYLVWVMGSRLFGGPIGGVVALLAWLVAIFVTTRFLFARWVEQRRRRLGHLADELAAIAAQSTVSVAPDDRR
jgi:hypothetical protein